MNEFNLKSAKDFLVNYLDCGPGTLDEILYDDLGDGDYDRILEAMSSLLIEAMIEFARQMCDKQKEICAEEAETKDIHGNGNYLSHHVIDENTILNASYPKEINYDES